MAGTLKKDKVVVEAEAQANRLYNKGFYGIPLSGGGLELNLFEARYLMETDRLEIRDESCEPIPLSVLINRSLIQHPRTPLLYPVYSDMRSRGYVLKDASRPGDFRVFPRGGGPGKAPSKYWLLAYAETDKFSLPPSEEFCRRIMDLKKEMLVATLDEEGDVTYYKISTIDLKGSDETDQLDQGYNGTIYGDRCLVKDGKELHDKSFFGRVMFHELQISLLEAYYLQNKGILTVTDGGTGQVMDPLTFHSYAAEKQKDYDVRYSVYSDLRDRGVIPKTGFKYGTAFRCYLGDPDSHHAEYLIQPVDANFECSRYDMSRAVRVAHSVRKNFAFARKDGDAVVYTKIERETP
ncbi:MAG: tRNA-intron lyase [Thermoplasmata archaeon]